MNAPQKDSPSDSLMPSLLSGKRRPLNLLAGDVVEVRSADEIIETLDDHNTFDSLPFMPEMLPYCGRRFRVYKRAHKTCDVIGPHSVRRMKNAVFLEDLRCDGQAHGGCQAACLTFWKEAWLKKVPRREAEDFTPDSPGTRDQAALRVLTDESLQRASTKLLKTTQVETEASPPEEIRYSCQATEMQKASSYMAWWDPRQYWQDWRSGNVGILQMIRALLISLFNTIQHHRRGGKYPFIEGKLTKTPQVILNVQPGDLVRLKPKDEILKTLDLRNRNRGLSFDRELVKFCGGTYRVLRRVEHEINNVTGKMMNFRSDCIVLKGVLCHGDYNQFCQRSIYHYVRETWLERVADPDRVGGTVPACAHVPCADNRNAPAIRATPNLSDK